jgi:DNA polymerase-4
MKPEPRTILHVDMDAFYASVEQRDNAELCGQPVVVGGSRKRGVVMAASYEVREFGVRSAMPMHEALRRCPQLVRVAPRMSHYKAVSVEIFRVFGEFTPIVEGLSLDEAFLDVSGSLKLHGSGAEIAAEIKRRIYERTNLTASVGVADNKLVAKIASDLEKPDGLAIISGDACQERLDPLPAEVIPGIGRRTRARLCKTGIRTIRDLRLAPDRDLEAIFGRFAQRTRQRAAGIDNRPVRAARIEQSVSTEETYADDLTDRVAMERELLRLSEATSSRLRQSELQAGTVQIKIRQADFQTCTRQKGLQQPVASTDQIYHVASDLLGKWLASNPDGKVRLLGVGTGKLSAAGQRDLFGSTDELVPGEIDKAVDQIRGRFGSGSVSRARTLNRR